MDIKLILIVVLITVVAVRFYKRHFGKTEGKNKSKEDSAGTDNYEPYSGG
jgi:hypothetical protein